MYNVPSYTSVNQGWQCPACRRCFAPFVQQCTYCPANYGITYTTFGGTVPTVTNAPEPYVGDTVDWEQTLRDSALKSPNICGSDCYCKKDGWP